MSNPENGKWLKGEKWELIYAQENMATNLTMCCLSIILSSMLLGNIYLSISYVAGTGPGAGWTVETKQMCLIVQQDESQGIS